MKHQRSIRSFIRIGLILSILLSLVTIGASIVLGVRYVKLRTQDQQYSRMISRLNQMVLDLGELEHTSVTLRDQSSEAYRSTYSESRKNYLDSLRDFSALTGKLGYDIDLAALAALPDKIENSTRFSFLNEQLNALRAQLFSVYEEEVKRIDRIGLSFIFTLSGFFFTVLTLIIVLSRSIFKYYDTINRITDHLRKLIRMETPERFIPPTHWKEEKEIAGCIRDLENDLRMQRKLLDLPVLGTLEDFLPQVFPILKQLMPCNRIGVAFLDSFMNVIAETAVTDYERMRLHPGYKENLHNTTLSALFKDSTPRIIGDLEEYYLSVHQSESTLLLIQEGLSSSLSVPITFEGKAVGLLFVNSTDKYAYQEKQAQIAQWVVNILKGPIFYSYILQEMLATSARSFADIVEKKDYETGSHLSRVTLFAYTIASELAHHDSSVTPKFVREIFWFAALHDIGKVGIPDAVLLKPGKLDPEEFGIIKRHVEFGSDIMEKFISANESRFGMRFFDTARDIILGHHEKWDGSGYPAGLKGNEIPLSGRIVALADVFDALTSERPYKPAFKFEEAVRLIKDSAGSHFDPSLVEVFLSVLPEIRRIYLASTGDLRELVPEYLG